MKKLLLLVCLLFGFVTQAQLVVTNNQTPTQLVQDVLLGAGVTVSNVKFNGSVANANLVRDQAARFSGGAATNLGLDAGVLLTTGKASVAPGPNNTGSANDATDTPTIGDADLGILIGNPSNVRNVAVLEFDFIPTGEELSFNFVFGSEEFPEWANSTFNDAFGFFLSGPGINGPFSSQAINIALIPGSTNYVTINNVFPTPYYITNTQNGIQYDGFTVVIPAEATVQCGQTYHIKLAIGNVGDNSFDSAVFLQANSFSTTPINLGADLTVDAGTAICEGQTYEICTGLGTNVPHQWFLDGVLIVGETDPCITVDTAGTYSVNAYPYGPACPISASVVIEIQDAILPPENTPQDLTVCEGQLFDLTEVEATVFNGQNPSNFEVYYYNSVFNAENGIDGIIPTTAYPGIDGEIVYIKIDSFVTSGCYAIMPFTLHVLDIAVVDTPANVITCAPYTLPALTNGSYYTAPGGVGTPLPVGTVISTSTTLYVNQGGTSACADESSFTITINTPPTIIDPTPFVVCDDNTDGIAIFNLPTKNNEITNGATLTVQYFVTGSLLPIANPATFQNTIANTQTLTVHVFDAASPDCYNVTTLQLIVNPKPAVTPISNYELCESSTPADGIEAFDLSTKTTQIINGQANISVKYYATQPAAQAGVPGTEINSAVPYNSTSAVIWVRLTNTVTTCFAVTSFNLVVNARPLAFQPEPMFECGDGVTNVGSFNLTSNNAQITGTAPNVTVSYHTTLADAQTGNSPLASPYETISTVVFIRVYNSVTTCYNTTSIELNVTDAPTIFNPTPLEVCDDNYDGLAAFNLTTKNDEITGGAALTVEYFETSTSATPITNLTNYQILNPNTYTLYVHVFDPLAPECFSTTTLQLIVNKKPAIAPISAYPLCETSIPADGIESFDLSTKTAEIINGQANIGVTYYTTQALAQAGVAGTEINSAVPYDSPSAVIWVRLENNITNCFAVTSFNLIVNPRPDAFEPAEMNGCSNGIVNTASFDLTLNNPEVTGGVGGVVVTYHLTLQDAEADANALPIPYVSGPAIIFIRVENTATGCFNTTQVQLNVTQGPTANTPTPLQVCDPNSDGFSTFNLADANEEISGGPVPAGVTITYHETETDAQFGENPQPSIYDNNVAYNQTIWVNVSYTLTGCSNIVELQLIVNNTPVATEIPALEVCDNNADGFAAFDLTTAVAGILNTLDPTTHAVTFYPTQADAQAATNVITNTTAFVNTVANTQTIWVRVENTVTGCFDVISLDLIVNALPLVATPIPAYTLCDVNNPGDQKEEFDLQSTIQMILNGQDGMEVSFYFDQANAQAKTNALPFLYTNVSNAQTIWVRVENLATGCFVLSRMDLRIEPLPVLYPPTSAVTECDQDGNGFASFDLDALVADLLQGEPNTTVTFHLTEQDALTSSNGQTSPFDNTTAFVDFIWVRAENTVTGCFSVLAIELNVVAAPKIPALDPIVKCDEDSNPQDGRTTFDLTVQSPIIIAAQIGAGPYTVTYYTTEGNATAGLSPIIQDTFYINTTNPQTIWVRVDDANSDCFAVKSFEISVNLPILLTRPAPLSLCDDGPTTALPQTVFDL
ncbi:MAG: choice-of-anchor L domain-containing protein, partial [Flavobacterium sp.]